MFRRYFPLSLASPGLAPPTLQLCWMLFLVSKGRLLPPSPDLVSAFSLLVCVVNTLLVHVTPKPDAVEALLTRQQEAGPSSVLHALTLAHKANWSSVKVCSYGRFCTWSMSTVALSQMHLPSVVEVDAEVYPVCLMLLTIAKLCCLSCFAVQMIHWLCFAGPDGWPGRPHEGIHV